MNIKHEPQDADFLEKFATKIELKGEWYYFPYWMKKLAPNTYVQVKFEDLPGDLKKYITEMREK